MYTYGSGQAAALSLVEARNFANKDVVDTIVKWAGKRLLEMSNEDRQAVNILPNDVK